MSAPTSVLPASCDHCRLRKVKCDRQKPCTNCRRRNTKCLLSTTTAKPRGREGGRRSKKSTELQARIAKLEALVNAVSADAQALPCTSLQGVTEEDPKSDDAATAKDSKLYQYAAGPVWSQLSSQIDGLREILLDSSDDEASNTPDTQPSTSRQEFSGPEYYQSMLLCSSSSLIVSDLNSIEHPPPVIREKLLAIYEQNVDPLCKVFHKPTLRSYMTTIKTNALVSREEAEVHAALFAVYGVAIVSMSDDDFDLLLGSPRNVVLRRFCFAIEFYLVKADYLESRRLGPLQALVVYLLIVRFLEHGQKHWILIGLAIQLARGLGLHSANSIQNFTPLQRELRCRLWHSLRLLDYRASLDRGTECVIGPDSYDTEYPQNLNDTDLFEGQVTLPSSREEITDVSLALIGFDGATIMTELHDVKPTHLNPEEFSGVWIHRQEIANNLEQRLKERWAKHCDQRIARHWMLNYIIDIMVTFCQLLAIRPMSHVKHTSLPLPIVNPREILDRSIRSLQAEELYFSTEAARGFRWFYWVHWYVLAVALVELSALPSALLEDPVWTVVSTAYDRQSHLVADTSTGSLWKPLRKLMSKVQLLRQSVMRSRANQGAEIRPATVDTGEQQVPVPNLGGLHIENKEGAPGASDMGQGHSGTQPTQSEALYNDLTMPDIADPFVHWDAFLGGMTDIDPFAFWDTPE